MKRLWIVICAVTLAFLAGQFLQDGSYIIGAILAVCSVTFMFSKQGR